LACTVAGAFFSITGSMKAGTTPTPAPVVNGKIAFVNFQGSSSPEIYVMDPNGSNLTNLSNNPTADSMPSWSPDGSRLAFTRMGELWNEDIYVMNADGSNQKRLTNDPDHDRCPAWSPDGTKIAFASDRNGNFQIYVMDADGFNPIGLTNSSAVVDASPTWSPDGVRIAFVRYQAGGASEIYVMNADGSNQTSRTNTPGRANEGPAWSPDGTRIAFDSDRADNRNTDIYVMDADGSNQTRLTNDVSFDNGPEWSPDGAKIAFTSTREGHAVIYVMDADGSNQIGLTSNLTSDDGGPRWQRLSSSPGPTPTPAPTATPTATATPTPTATPIATATPTPAATATATAPPSATPSPTPVATPSATPTPTIQPGRALNISTRLRVETGDNVMIGGFIITGATPKKVVMRGIGPSLGNFGLSDVLLDPVLELRSAGALLDSNDNWKDGQRPEIEGTLFQPSDDRESVIMASLAPAAYTAILAGQNQTAGIALVEIYDDDDQPSDSALANISTRGFVRSGDNLMIGGFILGSATGNLNVVIRGLGPSLSQAGLVNVLVDPTIELRDGNGLLLVSNDNWMDDAVSAAQLAANGLAPQDPNESAIFTSLPPGAYTAILAGKNSAVGIGLVEIYSLP
jgi:Tol biopolymer transport system component